MVLTFFLSNSQLLSILLVPPLKPLNAFIFMQWIEWEATVIRSSLLFTYRKEVSIAAKMLINFSARNDWGEASTVCGVFSGRREREIARVILHKATTYGRNGLPTLRWNRFGGTWTSSAMAQCVQFEGHVVSAHGLDSYDVITFLTTEETSVLGLPFIIHESLAKI